MSHICSDSVHTVVALVLHCIVMTSCTSVNMPCLTALVVITDMFPLYVSPSLRCRCLFMCMSAVVEQTLISTHCDLPLQVTRCLGYSVFSSVVANNCSGAPSSCSPMRTHCCNEFALVSLAFHQMCGICFGIFSRYTVFSLVDQRQSADVLAGERG